jgi:hypothetical protein
MLGKDLIMFKQCGYFELCKTHGVEKNQNYINPHKNGDSFLVYSHAFETFFFECVGFCRLHRITKPHSSGIIRSCNVYLDNRYRRIYSFLAAAFS